MGRGRAKAKQTKIAREIKYFTPPTDLAALQHELASLRRPTQELPDPANQPGDHDDTAASVR